MEKLRTAEANLHKEQSWWDKWFEDKTTFWLETRDDIIRPIDIDKAEKIIKKNLPNFENYFSLKGYDYTDFELTQITSKVRRDKLLVEKLRWYYLNR